MDMARRRQILLIIEEERLVENARRMGETLLTGSAGGSGGRLSEAVGNARGCGLMCAFDAPDGLKADQLVKACFLDKLAAGRLRPAQICSGRTSSQAVSEIEQRLAILRKVLNRGDYRTRPFTGTGLGGGP
ncbi:MAG: hypothetical protein R2864_08205 [Syntrophotaleaceae bacterium]